MNPSDQLADRFDGLPAGRDGVTPSVGRLVATLSFWGAIALPAFYIPLLFIGIEDAGGLFLFLALFGLHVVALFAGRSHRARSGR